MKTTVTLLGLTLILGMVSCKMDKNTDEGTIPNEVNESQVTQPSVSTKEDVGTEIQGLTCNEGYEMNIHWTQNSKVDSITVDIVNEMESKNVKMLQTHADHYASSDGYELKGADGNFTLAQDGKLICNCQSK